VRELLDPRSSKAKAAFPGRYQGVLDYRKEAREQGKQLLHIIWDEADGYPEHAWGYEQWSLRPYEQWYGCDGTTDANIHLIAWQVCRALGLDYPALYEQAYSKDRGYEGQPCWLRDFDFEPYLEETVIPPCIPPSDEILRGVLHDLHEINNHSVANLLYDMFTELGYDVEQYWLRPNTTTLSD